MKRIMCARKQGRQSNAKSQVSNNPMKTKQAPKQIPQQQIVHNHFGNRAHAAHKLRWYIAAPRLLPVPPLPYSGYPNRLPTESAPPRSPSTLFGTGSASSAAAVLRLPQSTADGVCSPSLPINLGLFGTGSASSAAGCAGCAAGSSKLSSLSAYLSTYKTDTLRRCRPSPKHSNVPPPPTREIVFGGSGTSGQIHGCSCLKIVLQMLH